MRYVDGLLRQDCSGLQCSDADGQQCWVRATSRDHATTRDLVITYVQEPTGPGREVVGVEVEERFRGQLLLKTHATRERTGQRIIFSIPHPPLVSASVDFTVCDNQLPSKRRHL